MIIFYKIVAQVKYPGLFTTFFEGNSPILQHVQFRFETWDWRPRGVPTFLEQFEKLGIPCSINI